CQPPPKPTPFPYTTLFRSAVVTTEVIGAVPDDFAGRWLFVGAIKLPSGIVRPVPRTLEIRKGPEHLEVVLNPHPMPDSVNKKVRSEEHTSELQSPDHLVCR